MYPTIQEVLDAYKAPAREVYGRVCVYNDTGSLTEIFDYNGDLIEFTVERNAPMGKFFGFLITQKLTFKLIGSHPIAKGTRVKPLFLIRTGIYFHQKDGVNFYVDEVVIDEVANTTKIIAYDILHKASEITIDKVNITYPTTLQDYTKAIISALGGYLNGSTIGNINLSLTNPVNTNGTETLREMLTAVAEATGAICYVWGGDYLAFRRLGKAAAVYTLDSSQYFEFSTKDDVTLTQIASTTQLGENISYGEEGFTQAMWDNPFLELNDDLENILETLGTELNGMTMTPHNLIWRGNPFLEIGDYIEVKTAKSNESKFIYLLNETITYNGGFKSVINWESEESEDIHSTPTNISEVFKNTFAKVDKINDEITIVAAKTEGIDEEISSLKLTTDAISASVDSVQEYTENKLAGYDAEMETLSQRVSATMTAEMVQLQIDETMKQGTTAVTTTTGFTFNEEGLAVSKSGSEMTTKITEDGMTVYRLEEPMLVANNEGVEAINLQASTYLIIGLNSRFEDYDNRTRTGCFWIGG